MTSLHWASFNPNYSLETIKFLVESQADINLKDKFGNTPLHFVCLNRNINQSVITFMVDQKADLKAREFLFGQSPFHFATKNKNISLEIAKYFISLGVSVHLKDKFGDTPIEYLQGFVFKNSY